MPQSFKILIKPLIFNGEKPLIINPEFMEFGNMNLSRFEITELRYGVKAISLYWFRIGRTYCIDVKSVNGNIIKIRISDFFKIKGKQSVENYTRILTQLYENYFNDILKNLLEQFNSQNELDILGAVFNQEGVLLNKKYGIVPWEDLGNRTYRTYYSLFAKSNPENYKNFEYIADWNAALLYPLSKHILKIKKLL